MSEILSDLPESIQLKSAILLYDVAGSEYYQDGSRLATIHDIHTTEAGPVLGSGTPLSDSALFALANQLTKSVNRCTLLPKQVIACGNGKILWVVNPKPRRMWLKQSSVQGSFVPHPKLIFRWHESGLTIFATKCKSRPALDTKLYQAPYYNTDNTGSVCMGSAKLPQDLSPDYIQDVEKAFFDSEFTHPHHHGTKLTNCPLPHSQMWESLVGKPKFPPQWLASTTQTVDSLLR